MTISELMSSRLIRDRFSNVVFANSHGAWDHYLGVGYLYYAFAAAIRSQVSVCIGSGGGFVPDLLAQAQRDLRLDPAATYLIDANLPDLGFGSPIQGGGWLRPESDFLRRATDIIVLQMLSNDAAKLFAAERINIDYLHIDGDHSRRGVIADFEDFAPLLSRNAVVSFHDAALSSVKDALNELRRGHPAWEFLALTEIGAGSAFMRRPYCSGFAARSPASDGMADRERRTRLSDAVVATAVEDSANRARYERWHYLATPAFRSRYEVIAPEIDREGGTIVEIGGFPNSVIDVTNRAAKVVAFEPYAPESYVARVREEARQRGIDYVLRRGTVTAAADWAEHNDGYSLVCLGLDLSAACDSITDFEENLIALAHLVRRADRVAAEFPQYPPSTTLWSFIKNGLRPVIVRDVKLDLSDDPVAEEYCVKDNRSHRRVIIFHPSSDNEPGSEAVRAVATRLFALKRELPPAILPEENGSYRIRAADLPSSLPENEPGADGERLFNPGIDRPGNATYGPYVRLRPGRYLATVRYESPAGIDAKIGYWDVCLDVGRKILFVVPLMGTGGVAQASQAEFSVGEEADGHVVEIRIYFDGVAVMCFRQLLIEPVASTVTEDRTTA